MTNIPIGSGTDNRYGIADCHRKIVYGVKRDRNRLDHRGVFKGHPIRKFVENSFGNRDVTRHRRRAAGIHRLKHR